MAENYIGDALSRVAQLRQQDFQNNLAQRQLGMQESENQLKMQGQQWAQKKAEEQQQWQQTIAGARFVQQAAKAGKSPKAVAEQVAPQFAQHFDQQHGAGSWAQLSDQDVLNMAQGLEQHGMAQLGQGPEIPKTLTVGKDQTLLQQSPTTGEISQTPVFKNDAKDLGQVKPEDFDPASIDKFKQTGNFSDLKRVYPPSNGQASAQSSIDAYKNDPALRRTAAIVVASDPARMRDYATFGAAGQGIRTQINQEIGQLKKETGMSDGDFVALRARAKADAANLTKLTAQNAQIEQAEGLMKANGQRALDLINMVDQTGIPLIEGFRRSAKAKTGGVNEAELKSVMTAFQAEVARLLTSGPTMNGVLSDSARAEVAQMAPETMSADQAKRVINRIFTEADIRHNLNLDQINKAAGGIPVGAIATPTPTPQQTQPPQPGEQTATGPNGQKIVLRNGQWVPL